PGRGSDPTPAAAQPCFLDTGAPPATTGCPRVEQPAFSGVQAFYSSGWLPPTATFTVPLSPTINSGTYTFRCLVHPSMTGKIDVVPPARTIPSPASDGVVPVNPAAVRNAGGEIPPLGVQTRARTVYGGSYQGSGFHNSGLLTSLPPGLLTYTLQFTAPGTFSLRCLVHPAMAATAKVGP